MKGQDDTTEKILTSEEIDQKILECEEELKALRLLRRRTNAFNRYNEAHKRRTQTKK